MSTESKKKHSVSRNHSIAIIGCGNMGSAIAQRLSSFRSIYLYDHHLDKAKGLEAQGFGIATENLKEAVEHAAFIILAIKPQGLDTAARPLELALTSGNTLISLLAGTSLQQLKSRFQKSCLIRMMPNTPLLCGEGMIALCSQDHAFTESKKKQLYELFAPLGKLLWLAENKIDAFTALAGSGPAFIFALTEAIVEAGIAMGFPAQEAQEITYQMLKGSAMLMETSGKHPAELKWQVTSPAGTTIAGLKAFEEHAVRSGIFNTFLTTFEKIQSLI